MKWLRRGTLGLAYFGLILALMPSYRYTMTPAFEGATETSHRFTLGLPDSPLLLVKNSKTSSVRIIRPDGGLTVKGEGSQMSTQLVVSSWSMLSLLFAFLLFEVDRRWLKKHDPRPSALPQP